MLILNFSLENNTNCCYFKNVLGVTLRLVPKDETSGRAIRSRFFLSIATGLNPWQLIKKELHCYPSRNHCYKELYGCNLLQEF
jgi:hypothetical protein